MFVQNTSQIQLISHHFEKGEAMLEYATLRTPGLARTHSLAFLGGIQMSTQAPCNSRSPATHHATHHATQRKQLEQHSPHYAIFVGKTWEVKPPHITEHVGAKGERTILGQRLSTSYGTEETRAQISEPGWSRVSFVHLVPRAQVVDRNVVGQQGPVAQHAFEHGKVARDHHVPVVVVWYHPKCM